MTSEAAAFFPNTISREDEARSPQPLPVSKSGQTVLAAELATDSYSSENATVSPAPAELPERIAEYSDDVLLKETGKGNKEALSILFRRYARPVRNVAAKILKNKQEAEDLVQDVFLYIFRKADQFDPALGNAGSWIIHVTYHRAFDQRRRLNSRHFYNGEDLENATVHLAAPYVPPRIEHSIQGVLGAELLEKFNKHLSEDQRRVIQLCVFEGYSLRDVAEITNQPIVNVRSQYYRGLQRMRRYVLPEAFRSK
ncbi:RNA polymerase sigma factor [Granulicella sp. WH15]|uniref:RNA polymerase sigma factor n=1 Tax=Granulicella sp. WH15 TaxID=2602070 RepID=UPI0013679750|nr:RNA polymerase sigma factor [Granulicella sp. WH15]QHN02735.1 RNA polymerase sigma factor [Granulicella sp. WH15]